MIIYIKNKHTLHVDEFKFKCCIGKKGSTANKQEGDKKTPKGIFEIENLYYRKDRILKPTTSLKSVVIKSSMGWCNDILLPKKYNKLIKIDKKSKHEKLKTESLEQQRINNCIRGLDAGCPGAGCLVPGAQVPGAGS